MDGKLTTPAALNGEVRTIPLIDKTLTIEGKCADAKATGDRFGAQAAIIEEHGRKIADNAAAIQSLRAENGVQDVTLGEHKTLIEGNAKKIAAAENSIGELHRMATEAENAINELEEKLTAGEESIADIYGRLDEQAEGINDNSSMITREVKPDLETAKNDIEVLKSNVANIEEAAAAEKESLQNDLAVKIFDVPITTEKITDAFTSYYVKSLRFCHAVLDFYVDEEIHAGEVVFGGLPKPAVNANVPVFNNLGGEARPLLLMGNGNAGVITSKNVINAGSRFTGSIAYIVAEDSTV